MQPQLSVQDSRCALDTTAATHLAAGNERSHARRLSRGILVPSGRVLSWQDEEVLPTFEVVDGVVRAVRLLENGDRQILAFFWPGAVLQHTHVLSQYYTTEAVITCRLRRLHSPPSRKFPPAECAAEQLLQQLLPLLLAIGQKNTIARLAWFLLRIRQHLPYDRRRGIHRMVLPRADIADHLGMSTETVCRTLAEFRHHALIDLPSRKSIRFLDISRLSQVANN